MFLSIYNINLPISKILICKMGTFVIQFFTDRGF